MHFHLHRRVVIVVLLVLGGILALLVFLSLQQIHDVSEEHVIDNSRLLPATEAVPLGPSDVGMIESWMTFDYVNHIFQLPAGYLGAALGIDDSRYPLISLGRYAQKEDLTSAEFVTQVRVAVSAYFASVSAQ